MREALPALMAALERNEAGRRSVGGVSHVKHVIRGSSETTVAAWRQERRRPRAPDLGRLPPQARRPVRPRRGRQGRRVVVAVDHLVLPEVHRHLRGRPLARDRAHRFVRGPWLGSCRPLAGSSAASGRLSPFCLAGLPAVSVAEPATLIRHTVETAWA
jgi:hypothetical protein